MSKKDELMEEGKKKIKKYVISYGVPIICIFFGVLVVLGLIFGPGIDFETMPATSSTPMMEMNGFEDLVKEIRERELEDDKDENGNPTNKYVSKKKEKTFAFIPEIGLEKAWHYKVQKNDSDERFVGHYLILDCHESADEYLIEMLDNSKGTKNGKWIPADYVEAAEEDLIYELVEATYEAAINEGVELTTYQIYAIAKDYYESKDGINKAKNDKWGWIAKIKDYISLHGKLPDYYGNHRASFSEEYRKLIDEDLCKAGGLNKELFVYGYFERIGKYCPK